MKQSTTLTFTGDIGFDKYMYKKWDDESLLDPGVVSFLKDSDHVIVNVEGPLYDKDKDAANSSDNIKKPEGSAAALVHAMDPAVCDFLEKINADVWNICNNHIMDAGPDGIRSTLSYASKCNAKTLGAGADLKDASSAFLFYFFDTLSYKIKIAP